MKKLLLILVLCLTGCPIPQSSLQKRHLEGREAAQLGLPANANPYKGTWREASEAWYKGYVAETHRIKREQD